MDKNSELYIVAKKYRRAKRAKKKTTVLCSIFFSISLLLFIASIIFFGLENQEAVATAKYASLACGSLLLIVGGVFLAILIKSVVNIKAILKLYTENELAPYATQVEKDIEAKKLEIERAKREREAFNRSFHPEYQRSTSASVGSSSTKSSSGGGARGGSFGTQDGYYKDSKGITRKVGEDFFDSEGVYRRAGENYFDGKGEMRSSGEEFYDAKGELRSSGDYFHDEK